MIHTGRLRQLVLEHELNQWAAEHSQDTHCDVERIRQLFESQNVALRLSQVRSLGNALAPQGASDVAQHRLARLHELVALKTQRQKSEPPDVTERLQPGVKVGSGLFWQHVGDRLIALRSGNQDHPGDVERFWNRLSARYPGLWDALDPVTADSIHLTLAEAFIHNLVEAWEYPAGRQQDETTD